MALFDDTFKHHLDRYKYASRYDGAEAKPTVQPHDVLAELEPYLEKGWIGGVQPSFSDIAVLPFVRQYRIADPVWFDDQLGLPNVQKWLMAFLDLPLFLAVMEKYDRWQRAGRDNFCPQLSGDGKNVP